MKPRMQRPFTATPGRQRGAVMVLIVIALASILLMGALALDGGHMLLNKTRLQNAVDAAALSGARTLQQVAGSGNASSLTQAAARNTLLLNAKAEGNAELFDVFNDLVINVELSSSVYGPFSFPGPTDARFVRVSVPEYLLVGFFWNFAQSFGNSNLGAKAVAAIATAGPSPTQPCKIEPLLVCGNPDETAYDPDEGLFWGYKYGEVTVLKSAAKNDSAIGPGNFQLLDFGSGGNTVRDGLAGGIEDCSVVGETAATEPGNKVGPVAQGLNTRFGEGSSTEFPADYVTTHDEWLSLDEEVVNYGGTPVQATDKGDLTAGSTDLFDHVAWLNEYALANCPGDDCNLSPGAADRRILNIVIGDCTGKVAGELNGKSDIPVLGFACYFTLQPVRQGGQEAQIFGQFVDECNGDNVPSATPWDDSGPNIIQLYKTYFNGGIDDPSHDS